MNILIYFPYNQRSVEQQSVMAMLLRQGHKVVLLTTCKRGYLHDYVEKLGVITEAVDTWGNSKLAFYRKNFKKLAAVLKQYKIETVIAHQQEPALVAGILRKFRKFKLLYFRHNTDESYRDYPRKAKWLNKIVNALTPVKVAPSAAVQRFWTEKEKVPPAQIRRVNYGYDFSQYEKPDPSEVEKIRNKYPAKLLVISMARLVSSKRHPEMFTVIKRLVDGGCDCKMICLGAGPLESELKDLIDQKRLNDRIFLLGQQKNIFDYMGAADVFLHLSSTEASNSAVKEAGLCKRGVIVCKNVGDFEEYITNRESGFLVSKDEPVGESVDLLKFMANNKSVNEEAGEALFRIVTDTFDINRVAPVYDRLLKNDLKS